jgi:photosynthetic reaction center cytochrome c subunit
MRIALSLIGIVAAALLTIAMMLTWERPPMEVTQIGYRGTGMEQVTNPRIQAAAIAIPEPLYPPESPEGTRASEVYENVQVLGDLSDAQFNRLMAHITEWVAPQEGCGYCHNLENMASDEIYTKVVARSMIQMTWDINQNWDDHVAETGVTCYTCHLGQPVPQSVWYQNEDLPGAGGMAGDRNGQNVATEVAAYSSLPYDALTDYLVDRQVIRVVPTNALPLEDKPLMPIQSAENTYGLMMHMSDALGVNCTFCHNTRSFASWETSPTQRTTAWYGINMVRDINQDYILPLTGVFPPNRLGPQGDVPKAVCSTCHNGVNKPLGGISMLQDHPELAGPPEMASGMPAAEGNDGATMEAPLDTAPAEAPADGAAVPDAEEAVPGDPAPADAGTPDDAATDPASVPDASGTEPPATNQSQQPVAPAVGTDAPAEDPSAPAATEEAVPPAAEEPTPPAQ